MSKDDVNVQVTDDAITIQGERKHTEEESHEGYYCSECSYGSFYRSIPLPEGANADQAKANFKNGVLEVTMPAPPAKQHGRRVEIQEAAASGLLTNSQIDQLTTLPTPETQLAALKAMLYANKEKHTKRRRMRLPEGLRRKIKPSQDRVREVMALMMDRGINGLPLRVAAWCMAWITAPTPIFSDGLIVVASGRLPERPIFVVRPTAKGDITLPEGQTTSAAIAWSSTGRGPYMPTPIAYDHALYVLANNGVFHAYKLSTGEELYETRLPQLGSGFSAAGLFMRERSKLV